MDPVLWNLLHDGIIDGMCGSVPGTIAVTISVRYLRELFPGVGTGFIVTLQRCTQLTFAPYDTAPLADLDSIAQLAPDILSANPGSPMQICCGSGMLTVQYAAATLALDTGEPITLEQLSAAATSYWRAFSDR